MGAAGVNTVDAINRASKPRTSSRGALGKTTNPRG